MAAAERLPIERRDVQPQLSIVDSKLKEEAYRDGVAHDIVEKMNHDRKERSRMDAFEKVHGQGLIIDVSPLVEARLFEEEQELEAEGMAAQFENTFGRQPVRKRLFGI